MTLSEPSIENPAIRRFQVLDAMVLVAATAVGLGAAESLLRSFDEVRHLYSGYPAIVTASLAIWKAADRVLVRLDCIVIAWAVALIVLRLRRPRPALRQLAARPGFATSLAILLNGIFLSAIAIGDRLCGSCPITESLNKLEACEYVACLRYAVETVAYAPVVAIVWAVLALSGAWTSEASWIDRAGRAVGWLVIGSAVVNKVVSWTLH